MAFTIKTPVDIRKIDKPESLTFESKLEIVNKLLIEFRVYVNEYKKTYSTKKFLFDCSNFLLVGEKIDENSYYKKKSIKRREIPLTSIKNKSISDYLYSSNGSDYEEGEGSFDFNQSDQNFVEYEKMLENESYVYVRSNKAQKLWEESKTHKMNLLYSCDDRYSYITDDTIKRIKFDDKNELNNYLNTYPKFIGDINLKKILVHQKRNGFINKETDLIEWILLNHNNEFIFNQNVFIISDHSKYETFDFILDNKSEMNSILCIYNGSYYFFDENINEITEFITQV